MDLCFITANCSGVTHLDLRTFLAERGLAWRETSLKALCSEHRNLEILEIALTFVPSTLWIDSTARKPHFLAKTTWSTSFRPITSTPCNSQSGKNIKQHVTRTSIAQKNYACPCSLTVPGLNLVCGEGCAHIISQIQNLNEFWRFCQAPHLDAGWEASSGGIWRVFRCIQQTHMSAFSASKCFKSVDSPNILDL